jgi:hypothetical protein
MTPKGETDVDRGLAPPVADLLENAQKTDGSPFVKTDVVFYAKV